MYNPGSTIKFREALECSGCGCSLMSPEQPRKSLRLCLARLRVRCLDPIDEPSELPDHSCRAPLFRLFGDGWAPFFVADALMQDQPDQPTLSMGYSSDGLVMSQTRDRAAIHNFEDASLGPGCSVGRLIEKAPHVTVALRAPMAVVHGCTLLIARASAHPRGETFLGGKGRCSRADFGKDLLRGIHAQTAHFRQPLDRILVPPDQTGHLLVQLGDLLVDQSQFLQRHLQQPPVDGI